ncbi:2-dehydro-3-deoxyglucarate aldolase [Burkholderia cepacia]|uniref:2-dehydro-3-deoxyglucarate aldolase n=1 Tax=Burkholderia cepacia TaxID=292 RepID=A0AAE8T550_BURCE|nr:4-hydroxy-2-oxo-heptane-1,7-dioate aldolase [Burkholderia cepacia]SQA51822.1 2-dehydro-3-deoxyglucarate aldolase [Burkholderia cepacia]
MEIPCNAFRAALEDEQVQIGLWVGQTDSSAIDAVADKGFDWLLIDGWDAPNEVREILSQLQAKEVRPLHAVVRPTIGDMPLIKENLDVGAQTLLVPLVETSEQAVQIVAATRQSPNRVRGACGAAARSFRWNRAENYPCKPGAGMCVLVQVETRRGLDNLDVIMVVEGVDGVCFVPEDLSAAMGYLGQPDHPEVQRAILDGIGAVRRAGKAPGILTADRASAQRYIEAGALFVAVGLDTTLLIREARELAGIAAVRRAGKAFCLLTVERVLAKRYVEAGALFAAVCVDTALLARAARELAAYFDKHESSGEVKTSSVY